MEQEEVKKPESKKKKVFRIILSSVVAIAIAVFFALSCFQFYLCVYLKPFWVDGQSMYPTLNYDAKNADGTRMDFVVGDIEGAYDIDCGVMDSHKSALKKLKRFDIVITKYPDKNPNDDFIKRLIGLPGETIEFINTGAGNEHNGDLYVNGVYTVQPISADIVRNGTYYTNVYKLADNEYFVAGDNRISSYSDDCRKDVGEERHIYKEDIKGKVIALTGKCKIVNGERTKKKYHWPRFIK